MFVTLCKQSLNLFQQSGLFFFFFTNVILSNLPACIYLRVTKCLTCVLTSLARFLLLIFLIYFSHIYLILFFFFLTEVYTVIINPLKSLVRVYSDKPKTMTHCTKHFSNEERFQAAKTRDDPSQNLLKQLTVFLLEKFPYS